MQPTFTSAAIAERAPSPTPDPLARAGRVSLWKSPGLLVLGVGLFLFQLANASMLPLVGKARMALPNRDQF